MAKIGAHIDTRDIRHPKSGRWAAIHERTGPAHPVPPQTWMRRVLAGLFPGWFGPFRSVRKER